MDRQFGEAEIERAVLAYLAERPSAMDTFEGIAGWWIHWQHLRFEIEALRRVVERLTERGVLERVEFQAEGRVLYRLKSIGDP
jgi:hypothetical protein